MSWQREVDGIRERRRLAERMGGEEAVRRHREKGRWTVRERIAELVDDGSFEEEGPLAGTPELDASGRLVDFGAANYVLGIGKVEGRPCVVGGEDFTQRGGSPSPAGLRKSVWAEDLALKFRLPLVRFLEGAGGSVTGTRGKDGEPPPPVGDPVYARARFASIARVLREVPVASAAMGPVAGFPAARLAASHFAVMHRDAQVLIGGPALVERALGERISKEALGGPDVHGVNGVVDLVVEDEAAAIEAIRRFLSYLPDHVGAAHRRAQGSEPGPGPRESLLTAVPRDRRQLYDMRAILRAVLDEASLFELGPGHGGSQITVLARLDGWPVGVLANDPKVGGGAMDAAGARKFRRFVELCETFRLPVVSFVDEPGFLIGSASERAGTIRYGVEAIVQAMRSTVPWISVLVRRAYGVAAAAHFGPEATVLAWPSADVGALPVEGGVAVAFRREIAAADDPERRRAELEEEFAARRSAFPRAESFSWHDLIDPRETRPRLCRILELHRRARS